MEFDPKTQKLDEILEHLRNLDRRDRMRTHVGYVTTILHIIPTVLLLGSVWFLYSQTADLITNVFGNS